MPSHCRCCSGHFIEDDVLGDCPGCPECAEQDQRIADLEAKIEVAIIRDEDHITEKVRLRATLEAVEQERDSFQRIGVHYQSVLKTAAELIAPGVCGRTAALVVTSDLPMLIAKLEAAERDLDIQIARTEDARNRITELREVDTLQAKLDANRLLREENASAFAYRRTLEAQIADLQAKLGESQREREKETYFDCHAGPGTTRPACGACVTCLLREVDTLTAKLEAAHEDVRALKDTLNLVYAVLQKGNKTTWGDTLLYAISTALARPSVRKILEGV